MSQSIDQIDGITAAPPGTVLLHEGTSQPCFIYGARTANLDPAIAKGDLEQLITVPGKSDIVLQPQPSCDPNDPLVSGNWS